MRLGLVILLLFSQLLCQGQLLNFKNYSLEQGLSNSDVNCMVQDARGYIWIGTRGGGVNVFDGIGFKSYTKEHGLPGNEVRSLLEDSEGNIWIGTNDGIAVYDGIKFRKLAAKNGLTGTNVLCLYQHTDGTIWAGTDDGGLNRIRRVQADSFQITNYDQSSGLSNNFIFDIALGPDGNIWLATFYGGIDIIERVADSLDVTWLKGIIDIPSELIITLQPDSKGGCWVGSYDRGVFHLVYDESRADYVVDASYDVTSAVADNTIWDLHLDERGDLWIATNAKGLSRLSGSRVVSYSENNGLPNNQLLTVMEDREGNLWLGTNGNGIAQFRGEHFIHLTDASDFNLDQVYCTRQLSDGRLVFASYGSGIAIQSDASTLTFDYLNTKTGLPGDYVSSISIDGDDRIWAATENGVVSYDGKFLNGYTEESGLLNNVVNVIHADAYGVVWCGTKFGLSAINGDRIFNLTAEEGLIDNTITDIIEDSRGTIWFATLGGLASYDRSTLRTYDEVEGLTYKRVNTLCEGPEGNIWISTNGGGLFRLDPTTSDSIFIHKVPAEGLSSVTYTDIQFLNDSILVAGFNRGFDRILVKDGEVVGVKSYGKQDGFIGLETNFNALYRSSDNKMWFGTPLGATRFDLLAEPRVKSKPKVHIDGLKLFYEEVDWLEHGNALTAWSGLPSKLELSHKERQLTFEYTGIFLSNPTQLRYSHFLEGADETWSPPMSETQITYPGLSPGKYTFKVIAIDGLGRESEPATFSFVIKPPWYQTPLFYVLSALTLMILIYLFIRYREMRLKEEKEHLERVVAERTAEVVEQKEIIEHKNKDITDSINYARRIQEAMLPNMDELDQHFKESMILFMPKDIVSGDFFWFSERKGKIYFTAADCTGHGVPGAFMSMIGASLLNDAVNEKELDTPADILNDVRDRVISSLSQTGAEGQQKDGMDMALCSFSYADNIVQFAGANNALYFLRNSGKPLQTTEGVELSPSEEEGGVALYEIKANKMPVGYYSGGQAPFDLHQFKAEEGDVIYTFSDGYPDQFGGPRGKKFKYSALKKKLIAIFDLPLEEQKANLYMTIIDWMDEEEQIDDICFVAVRV